MPDGPRFCQAHRAFRSLCTVEWGATEVFAETVNTGQKYQVFVTARGDSKGLFVSDQDARGFTIQESQGGTGSYEIDYRVVAKVRGYEKTRMEPFDPPAIPAPPPLPDRSPTRGR